MALLIALAVMQAALANIFARTDQCPEKMQEKIKFYSPLVALVLDIIPINWYNMNLSNGCELRMMQASGLPTDRLDQAFGAGTIPTRISSTARAVSQ